MRTLTIGRGGNNSGALSKHTRKYMPRVASGQHHTATAELEACSRAHTYNQAWLVASADILPIPVVSSCAQKAPKQTSLALVKFFEALLASPLHQLEHMSEVQKEINTANALAPSLSLTALHRAQRVVQVSKHYS